MSNRLSDEKAQAIAAEYCTNGFKKVMALLSVGYKQSYAEKVGLKLYDNVLVKEAIKRIQAKQTAKTGMTIEKMQKMYESDRRFAKKCNQAGARVSATAGIARLYGFDKDGGKPSVAVVNVINYAGASGVKPPPRVESEVIGGQV
ncbi:MAG: hypothetical protein ACYSUX_00340 [Planctomycetota bacterium]|jgi:exopolysaccharide biosynthesis protein